MLLLHWISKEFIMINNITIAIEVSNNDLPQVVRNHWIVLIWLYLNIELKVNSAIFSNEIWDS